MTDSPVAPVGDPETAQTIAMKASGTANIKAALTEYVVLQKDSDKKWFEKARQNAASAEAAIRATVGEPPLGGVFIAIPSRSFRPVTVSTKTVTSLVIEEAS